MHAPSASLSVVLGLWQDRPAVENVAVARRADELGYPEVWIGEMATYDAFVLATAIAAQTSTAALSVGPFAVHVRTPMTVAVGAASVADLTGRQVNVALGTSSDVVVERWHGRERRRPARTLEQHAIATRALLAGGRVDLDHDDVPTHGYRLRLPAVPATLSIAAFGPAALGVAARTADRLLLNMVTPAAAKRLRERMVSEATAAGVAPPRTAIWLAAAVDPTAETLAQIAMGKVGYLAAPGYGEMYAEAGFGDLVEFARTRPHPKELLAAIPPDLLDAVALIGSADDIRSRVQAYRDAGIDEICIVPATAGDDGGERTLRALAD